MINVQTNSLLMKQINTYQIQFLQQSQQKMKSKKKLIYKLHENINQNPFKKIDQVSFRNAGIRSYDFNKLKSIRAISLKGLSSDQIHSQKHPSDWKVKHDTKISMDSIKEEIQKKAQQALICNKKKIILDKSLISMQPKKLNARRLLKEKKLQIQHEQSGSPKIINSTQNYESNSKQATNYQNEKIKLYNKQKTDIFNQISPQSKRHSRNISLPVINSHKQEPQSSMIFIIPNKELDMLVEQQTAKQQIVKQIRLNAQEKINKQVLMSIKLKSIQNLERIARSQSQVIKIDKWKEKYSQFKNSQQISLKEKYLSPKNFLPQIYQKIQNKDDVQNTSQKIKHSQHSHQHMDLNLKELEQQNESQKSQIQLAKHLLYNVTLSQELPKQQVPVFSQDSKTVYRKQHYSTQENMENKIFNLKQLYQSQILQNNNCQRQKRQIQNGDFRYSQPLKITITQLKSQKNKHNQNLYSSPAQNNKLQKQKRKQKDLNSNKKNFKYNTQSLVKQKQLEIETTNQLEDKIPSIQQNPSSPILFKAKNKLYTGLQKGKINSKQSFSINSSSGFSFKQIHETKCKINEDHNILDQIMEDGMPQQWEQKRFEDEEFTDFDIFVQNQAKQA